MSVTEDTCTFVAKGADPAWVGFQRAHRELTRRLERALLERHDISVSALELLGRVAAQDDHMRRLSRLATDTGLSISRVSRLVDALEQRGLLRRQPCPADTRATNAAITAAGLALVHEAQAGHAEDVRREFLAALEPGEHEVLARVFARLTA